MAEKQQKVIKCPVCKEEYWSHAMKLHITNASKVELYNAMKPMMDQSQGGYIKFSSVQVMRNSPHYAFRRKHIKNKKVFEL